MSVSTTISNSERSKQYLVFASVLLPAARMHARTPLGSGVSTRPFPVRERHRQPSGASDAPAGSHAHVRNVARTDALLRVAQANPRVFRKRVGVWCRPADDETTAAHFAGAVGSPDVL